MSTPAPTGQPLRTGVDSRWRDVAAGLSIAGLLLPEAFAYAALANLPPQAGLIGLLAGLGSYALTGSSRYAVVSATSSSAAVLAAAVAPLAGGNPVVYAALAAGLVMLTGVLFMLAAAARLGAVSAFIAKPVLRGFAVGLAIVIGVRQLPRFVQVHPADSDLPRFVAELLAQHTQWNTAALLLGGGALVLLFALARWQRMPAALLVIVLSIVAYRVLDLGQYGVATVGPFTLALPAAALPSLTHAQWLRLGELAFAVVLVLYAESYGSIRSFALKHGDTVQANRDLFALGLANLLSGLGHGSPVGAGYSGTAANEAAGAQTRWAGVVAALVILAAVLTLLPMIAWTPEPVLAAVVVHAVSHSLRPAQLRPYFAWQRDRTVLLAAIAAVLVLGVLDGLLVAIAASLLFALRELAQARVSELGRADDGHTFLALAAHPDAVREPQLLILRPEAPLFFGNVERLLAEVRRLVNAHPDARGVILSLEESPDLDSSSIEALGDLALALQRHGRMLHLTRLKDPVYTVLCRADLPALGKDCLSVLSVDDAVRAARSALGITHP